MHFSRFYDAHLFMAHLLLPQGLLDLFCGSSLEKKNPLTRLPRQLSPTNDVTNCDYFSSLLFLSLSLFSLPFRSVNASCPNPPPAVKLCAFVSVYVCVCVRVSLCHAQTIITTTTTTTCTHVTCHRRRIVVLVFAFFVIYRGDIDGHFLPVVTGKWLLRSAHEKKKQSKTKKRETQTKQYSINMADEARDNHMQQIERAEIANLVRSRMESLNLPSIDYDDVSEKRNHLSYVIINPSCDLKLEEGDIM